MSVRPLIDLEKKPIGDVVLLRDVTATSHTMAKSLLWILVVGVSLIALTFWRCRWLMRDGQAPEISSR
jgi:hypothetical protein